MKFLNYKNILIIYFLYLIIGLCIYSTLQISEFPEKYVFTEWLINYEGGYVRRGLLGQLVFDISEILEINIKYLILIFQVVSYFIYFTIFYFIFSKIEINFFWLLIIFSPILFVYPLVELMVFAKYFMLFGFELWVNFFFHIIRHRGYKCLSYSLLVPFRFSLRLSLLPLLLSLSVLTVLFPKSSLFNRLIS